MFDLEGAFIASSGARLHAAAQASGRRASAAPLVGTATLAIANSDSSRHTGHRSTAWDSAPNASTRQWTPTAHAIQALPPQHRLEDEENRCAKRERDVRRVGAPVPPKRRRERTEHARCAGNREPHLGHRVGVRWHHGGKGGGGLQ
jgi:hypothetical protein